ncbi:MAG: amidohydrolase family protein [Phycisphaerales bacterium]|nr:amidohydrolase family protein [Phycisphaerales bacterium]
MKPHARLHRGPGAFRLRPVALCLLVPLALGPSAIAQDLGIKAAPQVHPTIITDATIHPVSSAPIEHGWIAFEDGRILGMGSGSIDVSTKSPGVMLDGAGLHVWPGLISPYSQLGLSEISSLLATQDYREAGPMTPEVKASTAVNPDSTLLPVTRSNGILLAGTFPAAGLSLFGGQPTGLVPGRGSVIRLDGWTAEDMTVRADAGLLVNFPLARPVRARWMTTGADDQAEAFTTAMTMFTALFDDAGAYLAAKSSGKEQPTDLRYEAMAGVLTPGEGQLPVYFRANDYDQIVGALHFAQEHRLRPVIVGGRDSHLCLDLLKAAGASVMLETSFRLPKRDDSAYDDLYRRPQQLQEAGVPYTFLSGDDTPHERSLPYAAGMAVAYGLSPEDAVRALTLTPAEILGIDKDYGSLEMGKSATLIVTTGNPLDELSNVELAFIDGRAIDLENKQTALAKKYRAKYEQLGLLKAGE